MAHWKSLPTVDSFVNFIEIVLRDSVVSYTSVIFVIVTRLHSSIVIDFFQIGLKAS